MNFIITLVSILAATPLYGQGEPITDIEEVQFGCLNLDMFDGTYVLNSEVELERLLQKNKSNHSKCGEVYIPKIDFTNRTIVAVKIRSGGCGELTYAAKFFTESGFVTCQVRYGQGNCKALRQEVVWWSIPKTDKTHLKFEVKPYGN